ncbi:MAG: cofactor-independent phosphoglycerate mutase [bacterium]
MKYVIIQGDGMADRRGDAPGDTTPLEAARTPHFDRLAGAGRFGLIHTIPEGFPPGSDVGNLSLFGYDPALYYTGRSPLEAAAMGVRLGAEDVAFRMNLVTLENHAAGAAGAEMADYSAGHIANDPAARIVSDLNAALADESFQFYPGVSYRHLLVWRKGLDTMTTTPPHDILGQTASHHLPRGDGAGPLLRIMDASREMLAGHPVNEELRAAGAAQVTQVWLWGQGRVPSMPPFQQMHGLRGACISAVDLVRGVAVCAGFSIIKVPGATGYIDTDYTAKGRYALKALKHHDLVFVHIEAPDESGHMGNRGEKIKAIEAIDGEIVCPLLENLPSLGDFTFVIVSDHATPVSLRTHTPDPVPFTVTTAKELERASSPVKYGEREAAASGLVIRDGHTLMKTLLEQG